MLRHVTVTAPGTRLCALSAHRIFVRDGLHSHGGSQTFSVSPGNGNSVVGAGIGNTVGNGDSELGRRGPADAESPRQATFPAEVDEDG